MRNTLGKRYIIETPDGVQLGRLEGAGIDCPRIGESIDLESVSFKVNDVRHTMKKTFSSVDYYIRIIVGA